MKTCTLKSLRSGVIFSSILLMSHVGAMAAVFTSFEPEEGFTPGGRGNSAGWDYSDHSRVKVIEGAGDLPAFDGRYSLSLMSEAGQGTVVYRNREAWANPDDLYNTYSVSFTNPTATYSAQGTVAWIYISLHEPLQEGGFVRRDLQIYLHYGQDSSDPYLIRFHTDNGTGQAGYKYSSINQNIMDYGSWNTISAVFDFEAKNYNLALNGNTIVSDISLPASWHATAIIGTSLNSPSTGVVYYDAVTAFHTIPEATPSQMLGFGGVLLLGWQMRRLARSK